MCKLLLLSCCLSFYFFLQLCKLAVGIRGPTTLRLQLGDASSTATVMMESESELDLELELELELPEPLPEPLPETE